MAERDDSVYVEHIIMAAEQIAAYIEGASEREFWSTPMVQDAVIRQLEVIGEATKNLSSEFRSAHGEIPWTEIAGMRDKLIHGYMGVDIGAVWTTATQDVPALRTYLGRLRSDQ